MREGALDNATGTDRKVISVVTATFNAMEHLPALIESLRQQTNKNFQWVVADGASADGTLELLRSISDLDVTVLSAPDFGIYDALNKGVKAASGEYYVVAGADDVFYPNAIADFSAALATGPDMVAACISAGGEVVRPGRGPSWLCGQAAFIAGHATGTLIKRSLHTRFGYYSRKFPITADQLFIKKCCQADINLVQINTVVGEYGLDGVSGVDVVGTLSEFFRVQLLTEKNKFLQVLIYVCRLVRHFSKL
jgi:glycosyltransferase